MRMEREGEGGGLTMCGGRQSHCSGMPLPPPPPSIFLPLLHTHFVLDVFARYAHIHASDQTVKPVTFVLFSAQLFAGFTETVVLLYHLQRVKFYSYLAVCRVAYFFVFH